MLSCLWNGAYKRILAATRITHEVVAAGFLSRSLNGSLPYDKHHITVY